MDKLKITHCYGRGIESYTVALKRFANIINGIIGYDGIKITKKRKLDAAIEVATQLKELKASNFEITGNSAFNEYIEESLLKNGDINSLQYIEVKFADKIVNVEFFPRKYKGEIMGGIVYVDQTIITYPNNANIFIKFDDMYGGYTMINKKIDYTMKYITDNDLKLIECHIVKV